MTPDQEIVPGYNDAKESLMAKLEEPMEMYLLVKLKLEQLKKSQSKHPVIEQELKENLLIHARQIDEALLNDIENQ
jgi:hypothetical protein